MKQPLRIDKLCPWELDSEIERLNPSYPVQISFELVPTPIKQIIVRNSLNIFINWFTRAESMLSKNQEIYKLDVICNAIYQYCHYNYDKKTKVVSFWSDLSPELYVQVKADEIVSKPKFFEQYKEAKRELLVEYIKFLNTNKPPQAYYDLYKSMMLDQGAKGIFEFLEKTCVNLPKLYVYTEKGKKHVTIVENQNGIRWK